MSAVVDTDYAEATDQRLLSLYQRKRDQEAFAELVHRYGSLILGVAQRMLGCAHTAEDVLQATFLVLTRDARKIRKREALASWLYGVAFRISARHIKRRARQSVSVLKDEVMIFDDPLEKLSEQFEQQAAFEELHRLPEAIRGPMILRYLQGKSNAEVATCLALSESAIEGRLKRGRNQLRLRLARQGVAFAAAIVALEATKELAAAADQPQLFAQTIELCCSGSSDATLLDNKVFQLANEEALKMTTYSLLKHTAVTTLAIGILATGWSVAGNVNLNAQDHLAEIVLENPETTGQPPVAVTKITGLPGSSPSALATGNKTATEKRGPINGRYSVESITANEKRIIEAMRQQVSLEFADEPLRSVIRLLEEDAGIQIAWDRAALNDENLSGDEPVSCDLSNIQLQSALNLVLDQYDLTTMIKDEVLMVTSKERAEEHLANRVYRLDPAWQLTADELIEVITATVEPNSWHEVGGPGRLVPIRGGFVISAADAVHAKINQLLGQIDRVR